MHGHAISFKKHEVWAACVAPACSAGAHPATCLLQSTRAGRPTSLWAPAATRRVPAGPSSTRARQSSAETPPNLECQTISQPRVERWAGRGRAPLCSSASTEPPPLVSLHCCRDQHAIPQPAMQSMGALMHYAVLCCTVLCCAVLCRAMQSMATYQGGKLCPDKQPDWSAFRDSAAGHGGCRGTCELHAAELE